MALAGAKKSALELVLHRVSPAKKVPVSMPRPDDFPWLIKSVCLFSINARARTKRKMADTNW
jgi:hypothetical protein